MYIRRQGRRDYIPLIFPFFFPSDTKPSLYYARSYSNHRSIAFEHCSIAAPRFTMIVADTVDIGLDRPG